MHTHSAIAAHESGSAVSATAMRPRELAALEKYGSRLRFAPGKTIFAEGDRASSVYRVLCGAVRLCKYLADGRRQIIGFAQPGEFFGLTPAPSYSFTAEAVNDTVVVSSSRSQIEGLAGVSPAAHREFFDLMSAQMLKDQLHLVMLGRQSAREKLATFLIGLADRCGAEDGDIVELPMGRQDIADYLGLTIETVCREMTYLKRAGTIAAPDQHSFVIRDVRGLGAALH
jgi:CRP/FNR family nitrogen fixation transcriptional regulator